MSAAPLPIPRPRFSFCIVKRRTRRGRGKLAPRVRRTRQLRGSPGLEICVLEGAHLLRGGSVRLHLLRDGRNREGNVDPSAKARTSPRCRKTADLVGGEALWGSLAFWPTFGGEIMRPPLPRSPGARLLAFFLKWRTRRGRGTLAPRIRRTRQLRGSSGLEICVLKGAHLLQGRGGGERGSPLGLETQEPGSK